MILPCRKSGKSLRVKQVIEKLQVERIVAYDVASCRGMKAVMAGEPFAPGFHDKENN